MDREERVPAPDPAEQTLRLREEELVARKRMEEVGRVEIRTEVEEFPGRLEIDRLHEELDIEHVPLGQTVTERRPPWEEDGVLVVPVYEEQLVVTKRLVLKEQLRVRRIQTVERQLVEDVLRRERAVVQDPTGHDLVHERYATEVGAPEPADGEAREGENRLADLVKRAFG
jgi:uncharacterized protein (TIGR02271 family)